MEDLRKAWFVVVVTSEVCLLGWLFLLILFYFLLVVDTRVRPGNRISIHVRSESSLRIGPQVTLESPVGYSYLTINAKSSHIFIFTNPVFGQQE